MPGAYAADGSLNVTVVTSGGSGKVNIDQSNPGTSNAVFQTGSQVFPEAANGSAAANAVVTGSPRDGGVNNPWCKFNLAINSNQAGSVQIQGSNDNFGSFMSLSTQALTAGSTVIVSVPVVFRYHRLVFTNGATAATYSINTSYTAA